MRAASWWKTSDPLPAKAQTDTRTLAKVILWSACHRVQSSGLCVQDKGSPQSPPAAFLGRIPSFLWPLLPNLGCPWQLGAATGEGVEVINTSPNFRELPSNLLPVGCAKTVC